MPLAYLYETTALDDDGMSQPIRLSTGSGYSHPSAPGFFDPRISGATDTDSGLTVQRSVFANGKFGSGDLSYGSVNVVNVDGALDALLDLGFGQPATLRLGEEDGPYTGFEPVLTATAGAVTVSDTLLSIGWKSRMVELDQPACPATFAGDNSGTTGLDGTADDIKGSAKPWCSGIVRGLTPVLLNTGTRVVGWNWKADGTRAPTHSLDALRFTADPWTLDTAAPGSTGGDYATSAAMLTALASYGVSVGYYVTCLAESLAALGGSNSITGGVTLDVTVEATAADRYAVALWKACLLRSGVSAADVSSDAVAALAAAAPYQAGYYATSESFRDVADILAASVAACYVPDRLGVYGIWQMGTPSGMPVAGFKRLEYGVVAELTDGDLKQITPSSSGDDWTPTKQVRVAYAKNWTVLGTGQIADAVTDADRVFVSSQWRYTAPAIDTAITAKYDSAITRDFETVLANEADAVALGTILLGIFGPQRREYTATVSYDIDFAALIDLGAVVRVTHPKFGMSAGVLAAIHTIRLRDSTQEADIKLWF